MPEPQSHSLQPGWSAGQRILNAHEVPPGVHHDVQHPIPVVVRVVWEDDGEEQVETVALEWTSELVRVRMRDHRCNHGCVWVPAADVKRRSV